MGGFGGLTGVLLLGGIILQLKNRSLERSKP